MLGTAGQGPSMVSGVLLRGKATPAPDWSGKLPKGKPGRRGPHVLPSNTIGISREGMSLSRCADPLLLFKPGPSEGTGETRSLAESTASRQGEMIEVRWQEGGGGVCTAQRRSAPLGVLASWPFARWPELTEL